MRFVRPLVALLCAWAAASLPAAASRLVTGNGFGFAVVSPDTATVTKFYPHPYSFARADPQKPLSEGVETVNFIKSLKWMGGGAGEASAEYEQDSQIIRMHSRGGDGFVFMPFRFEHPGLILDGERGATAGERIAWSVEWSRPLTSRNVVQVDGNAVQLLAFDGIDEVLVLIPLGPKGAESDEPLAASAAWALVVLENDREAAATVREFDKWRAGLEPQALVKRELAEVEQWRAKPAVQFASKKEQHLWRQSEMMLRIAQSREPNREGRHGNGLIVACLPDGVYFTPWVRDMAWSTVALARMGHKAEARAAVLAYFDAQPTGKMRTQTRGADYQVSVVRYFGDGAEEPFFTEEGSTNIEFDNWGEVLWVLGEYLRVYNDDALLKERTYRGRLYDSARDFIVRPLEANLEDFGKGQIVAADTSIWEERQKDKKHFAFSTAMAIVGLRAFAEMAQREGDSATRASTLQEVGLLQTGFNAAFIRDGKLRGTLEEGVKNNIDGALLQIINFGVVTDAAVVRDTLERMALLKVVSGGYRRVRGTFTDPAIFEYWYEQEEFLFVDFSLAEVERRMGRDKEAAAMLARIVDKAAADHDVIPEMYVAVPCSLFPGKIGDPTGALPMVGYGAGEFVLHLLEREKVETSHSKI